MGFETVVLDKVAKVLKSDNLASFFCGTLCVVCTASEANRIAKNCLKNWIQKFRLALTVRMDFCLTLLLKE